MKKEQAIRVAKDLIEGGVDDPLTVTVNLAIWGVTKSQALKVKKVLCKYDVKRSDKWLYDLGNVSIQEKNNASRQMMFDAIENGWEDAALGIKG